MGEYCSPTISSHSSLCAGEQVSEEPLGVLGLGHWLTQTVDEDRSAAVGLQHRAHNSLEEDEELLVLCGNAHLKRGEKASDSVLPGRTGKLAVGGSVGVSKIVF